MLRQLCCVLAFVVPSGLWADPLPSWSESRAKTEIVVFVESVPDPSSEMFVPVADRIAVFDNDGTLWSEQPVYFQLIYAVEMLQDKAASDPSILTSDPLKAAAAGEWATLAQGGKEALIEVLDVSHSGMSGAEFQANAYDWVTTAQHPTSGLTYAQMTYQPMLELLSFLRDKGFATYIVSGGGIDFIRAIAEEAYGIPPEQVIGSQGALSYQVVDGVPMVVKGGGVVFVDDGPGKPVGIMRHIGKRPILAGGNSDGDLEMIEWTTSGDGPRLGVLVHHTDADREFAYDREGHIGVLNRGLDEANDRGWVLVDIAQDWGRVWSGP